MKIINDVNIQKCLPLLPPSSLQAEFPLSEEMTEYIDARRRNVIDIITRKDERLLAVVGPCSIHDEKAALEYAHKLKTVADKVASTILVIMRVYFEKPRTSLGWKGLIADPFLDGSDNIEEGLRIARRLLIAINEIGLPVGSEILEPIVPQYITDLISWAAIGARTTESQIHREMASGLSMPVGFKNATDGSIEAAVNSMESSLHPHSFIGIDHDGRTSIIQTKGNPAVHVILRGGANGPNYYEECVEEAEAMIASRKMTPSLVIDCSHGNSGKKSIRQRRVLSAVLNQKEQGNLSLHGFMLESNLFSGKQKLEGHTEALRYGVSVTDECIGWDQTEELLLSAHTRLQKLKK